MFNPSTYENSRPGGIGVLEVLNGVKRRTRPLLRFVPLKRTELQGEISGPLAALPRIAGRLHPPRRRDSAWPRRHGGDFESSL